MSFLLLGQLSPLGWLGVLAGMIAAILLLGGFAFAVRCYHKVAQGTAIVRNGWGNTKVNFSGLVIVPVSIKPN